MAVISTPALFINLSIATSVEEPDSSGNFDLNNYNICR
jgi:hypothetical protein